MGGLIMEEKLVKEFEELMMNTKDAKVFNGMIIDYYKKHTKDTFEYPKERYDELSKPGMHTWTMEDIVVFTLVDGELKDRVKLI